MTKRFFYLFLLLSLWSCNDKKDLISEIDGKDKEMRLLIDENKKLQEENQSLKALSSQNVDKEKDFEAKLKSCQDQVGLYEKADKKTYYEKLIDYYKKEKLSESELSHIKRILSFLSPEDLLELSKEREESGKRPSLFMISLKQKNKEVKGIILKETSLRPFSSEYNINEVLIEFLVGILDEKEILSDEKLYSIKTGSEGEEKSGLFVEGLKANHELLNLIASSCLDGETKKLAESCEGEEGQNLVSLSKYILKSKRKNFIENLIDKEKIEFNSADLYEYMKEVKDADSQDEGS